MNFKARWFRYRSRFGDDVVLERGSQRISLERGLVRSRAELRYFGRLARTSGWVTDAKAERFFLAVLKEVFPDSRGWPFQRVGAEGS